MELDAISRHLREVVIQFGADFDTAFGQFALREHQHVCHDVAKLQRGFLGNRFLCQRPDARDDGASTVRVVDNVR